ncbi:MAG: flagellar filament capping protein FliD [bacterium]
MSVNQISGIVSGLDTASLIDALVTSRSGPIALLQNRQSAKTAELAAWQSFEAILVSMKIEATRLGDRSLWDGNHVESTDEDFVTASAATDAAFGSWDFFVERLASAHQVQSQAFDSTAEVVGSGTMTITGPAGPTDIDVAAGTTLADLANLINESAADVTATLVRSEAAGQESYHLVLVSDATGELNRFTVDTSGLSGGTTPDLASNVTDGLDAILRFGGENGLQLYSATNTFEDVVEGLDITVHKTHESGSAERATVSVSRDVETLSTSLSDFVDRFNSIVSFVNSQYSYDPDVGVRPPLIGNSTLTGIASDIRRRIMSPLSGFEDATYKSLLGIGISSGSDGTLKFDETEFRDALENDFDAVANLFRTNATFDGDGVRWLSAPKDLLLGGESLEISVTAAATRAKLDGATIDLSGGITIDGTNDAFVIELDGRRSEIVHLTHGTYTDGDALATAIQRAIDGSDELNGLTASVSFAEDGGSSGHFEFTSTKFGSATKIKIIGTTGGAAAALGLTATLGTEVAGTDVEGTINGEAATGKGQILTADDDTTWAGLQFQVTDDGTNGPVTFQASFTEGIGGNVDRRLVELTDSVDGTLARISGSVERLIDRYAEDILRKQDSLDVYRSFLERKYANLESVLNQLQSQSNFISAQTSALTTSSNG